MDESKSDDLRAAYLNVQAAQARLDADRDEIRKKLLDSEPTWGPCHQCGHTWRSRNMRRRLGKPPRQCPNCHSHYWFDPEYVPRKVPVQSGKAAGAETKEASRGGAASSNGTAPAVTAPAAPFAMPPPPKFAPPESVRFAEEDPLEMMKKARKDDDKTP